ncbi:MAG TPA: hypothetical protein VGJ90_11455 [Methylophilaceae bacterium]|jgi:hypothetical protein
MTINPIEDAIRNLGVKNLFKVDETNYKIAFLLHESDWHPLKADWWRGKQVCIIGADINGNFFLRHSDGSVRYWEHKSNSDKVISKSVKDFINNIEWSNDF